MREVEGLIQALAQDETIALIIQLMMAIICGGIIGIERGRKGMAAGFRTHILVCLGSTLVMITNMYIYEQIDMVGDPTRIAAQVVSGIGFLGAGTILVTGENRIRGLTTAAGLWASACMGLAIGVKYYSLAILGCLSIFLVMTLFNRIDKRFYTLHKKITLEITFNSIGQLKEFIEYVEKEGLQVENIQINEPTSIYIDNHNQRMPCKIILVIPEHIKYEKLVNDIQKFSDSKIKTKKFSN